MTKLVVLMALAALSAPAQDWARQRIDKSPRHTEWVMVKHGDRSVQTFVVYPEVKEKAPVVLVIHEIFGMTDWVQEVADEFAAAGYIAVAPDLLSGMGPDGKGSSSFAQGDATKAVSGLNPDQVTADLQAAADYAQKLPSAGTKLVCGRDSVGAVARAFVLPPTGLGWPRRSFFMDLPPRPRRWRGSPRRSMDSMAKWTHASIRPFRRRRKQ